MAKPEDITILLADDEPDILEIIEEEFQDEGYNTMTANCGNLGAEMIRENAGKIQVVISDFKMPDGDGMVILQECNKLAEGRRPLFFFVSGQADVPVQECLDAGANSFFQKPFDVEELIKQIGEHVGVEGE
jgi:DNA-binding response OmpR family regulator